MVKRSYIKGKLEGAQSNLTSCFKPHSTNQHMVRPHTKPPAEGLEIQQPQHKVLSIASTKKQEGGTEALSCSYSQWRLGN